MRCCEPFGKVKNVSEDRQTTRSWGKGKHLTAPQQNGGDEADSNEGRKIGVKKDRRNDKLEHSVHGIHDQSATKKAEFLYLTYACLSKIVAHHVTPSSDRH